MTRGISNHSFAAFGAGIFLRVSCGGSLQSSASMAHESEKKMSSANESVPNVDPDPGSGDATASASPSEDAGEYSTPQATETNMATGSYSGDNNPAPCAGSAMDERDGLSGTPESAQLADLGNAIENQYGQGQMGSGMPSDPAKDPSNGLTSGSMTGSTDNGNLSEMGCSSDAVTDRVVTVNFPIPLGQIDECPRVNHRPGNHKERYEAFFSQAADTKLRLAEDEELCTLTMSAKPIQDASNESIGAGWSYPDEFCLTAGDEKMFLASSHKGTFGRFSSKDGFSLFETDELLDQDYSPSRSADHFCLGSTGAQYASPLSGATGDTSITMGKTALAPVARRLEQARELPLQLHLASDGEGVNCAHLGLEFKVTLRSLKKGPQ